MSVHGLKDHYSIFVPSTSNLFSSFPIPDHVQEEFDKTPQEICQVGVASLIVPGLVGLFSNHPQYGMRNIHIAHGTATKYQEETPSAYELHIGFHKDYGWDGCYGGIEQDMYRVHSVTDIKQMRLAYPISTKLDPKSLSNEQISGIIQTLFLNGFNYLKMLSAQDDTNIIQKIPHLAIPKLLSSKDLYESLIIPYSDYWKDDDTKPQYSISAESSPREIREAAREIAQKELTDLSTANLLRLHALKTIALMDLGDIAHTV